VVLVDVLTAQPVTKRRAGAQIAPQEDVEGIEGLEDGQPIELWGTIDELALVDPAKGGASHPGVAGVFAALLVCAEQDDARARGDVAPAVLTGDAKRS
jgi:hypothetical protein